MPNGSPRRRLRLGRSLSEGLSTVVLPAMAVLVVLSKAGAALACSVLMPFQEAETDAAEAIFKDRVVAYEFTDDHVARLEFEVLESCRPVPLEGPRKGLSARLGVVRASTIRHSTERCSTMFAAIMSDVERFESMLRQRGILE